MDYANGKIYKLFDSTDHKLFYVGSTCDTLIKRKNAHLSCANTGRKTEVYDHIRTLGSTPGCFYIELHEAYPCENRTQLNKREGEIFRYFKGEGHTLKNKNVPGRTLADLKRENPEKLKKERAEYYQKNKEKWSAYNTKQYEKKKKMAQLHHQNHQQLDSSQMEPL